MHRALIIAVLSILASAAGHAEDFSGLYAGVHAGAAMDRRGDRISTVPVPERPRTASPDHGGVDLPPSAAIALKRAGAVGPSAR